MFRRDERGKAANRRQVVPATKSPLPVLSRSGGGNSCQAVGDMVLRAAHQKAARLSSGAYFKVSISGKTLWGIDLMRYLSEQAGRYGLKADLIHNDEAYFFKL